MPHGRNFGLFARPAICFGYLRFASALLLNVSFDHLRCGAGGVVAMLAFFQQDRDHDLGIAARGNPHEPAIVLELLSSGAEALLQIVGDRLRASGLPCEINALQGRTGAVPTGETTCASASVIVIQFSSSREILTLS